MTPDERALLRDAAAHVLLDDIEMVTLDDDSAHHLFRVLRVRDGEIVTVTDGSGGWRVCRSAGGVLEPNGPVCRDERTTEPARIAVAVPKRDRPEWIVQKLTELGVDEITLLHADRSVVRWDPERADKHRRKLGKVMAEALQQSRGVWLPSLVGPVDASAVLNEFAVAEPGGRPITDRDRAVAIGPEGGWSEAELSAAADQVGLGATVLRVETAALAVASRLRLR
ncbi:16S rRNA (uracil1498-N3)-methyltransferase [Ilumatobacter fluminis]|uniref:Ribosomal RNA small subunit methyltransferase E n=1 Tax=Ilumatobacter fluminis TaxID=467091 RepID=A0A4R7I1U8_9ACTN|nr:RsmE family RNA methyltransferase [Ilumatobacter fluminis]TDT16849.1 16S rRNA (uracil1498-N3)-methyltransferase [Ilumatobacter fluminis]